MENDKKQEMGDNCQNDIKSININNPIRNNPQEIANTFNDYFLTLADTITGNIKKDNNDPRENLNPSNYLIYNFNSTFPGINWNYATPYEIDNLSKSLKTKNSYGYDEIPIKIIKFGTPQNMHTADVWCLMERE